MRSLVLLLMGGVRREGSRLPSMYDSIGSCAPLSRRGRRSDPEHSRDRSGQDRSGRTGAKLRTRLRQCPFMILALLAAPHALSADPEASCWKNLGPYGGEVTSLAIHPTDPNVFLAGSMPHGWTGNGIFRSSDRGRTWESAGRGLPKDLGVMAVCVDPYDPSFAYAGAADTHAFFKSTDGDRSWRESRRGIPSYVERVHSVTVPIGAPGTVIAGTPAGIFRSTDRGETWTKTFVDGTEHVLGAFSFVWDQTRPGVGYCSGWRLSKTTDYGRTWTTSDSGLPSGPWAKTWDIALDPANPDILYAITVTNSIYVSSDAAKNWVLVRRFNISHFVPLHVAVDPVHSRTIYVSGSWDDDVSLNGPAVYKSTDGGTTWNRADLNLPVLVDLAYPWDVLPDPMDPTILYLPTTVGLYRSADGASHWEEMNEGLISTWVEKIAIGLGSPPAVYSVGRPLTRSVYGSADGGATWSLRLQGVTPSDVARLIVTNPHIPGVVYFATEHLGKPAAGVRIYRSEDGAASWAIALDKPGTLGDISFILADLWNPRVLYAGLSDPLGSEPDNRYRVLKSRDGGESWGRLAVLPDGDQPRCMAIDPRQPGTFFVGGFAGIYLSRDGGKTWARRSRGIAPGLEVYALAISPAEPDVMYAATEIGVFKTSTAGTLWQSINEGLPGYQTCLAIDPSSPDTLYVGTSFDGLFKSSDGGQSWRSLDACLGSWMISSVALDHLNPGTIYVGTRSSGIFMSTTGGE